jgi:hypothetical protein
MPDLTLTANVWCFYHLGNPAPVDAHILRRLYVINFHLTAHDKREGCPMPEMIATLMPNMPLILSKQFAVRWVWSAGQSQNEKGHDDQKELEMHLGNGNVAVEEFTLRRELS